MSATSSILQFDNDKNIVSIVFAYSKKFYDDRAQHEIKKSCH